MICQKCYGTGRMLDSGCVLIACDMCFSDVNVEQKKITDLERIKADEKRLKELTEELEQRESCKINKQEKERDDALNESNDESLSLSKKTTHPVRITEHSKFSKRKTLIDKQLSRMRAKDNS